MAPNETSALLKNYRYQHYNSDSNHNNADDGYHTVDDNNHIVYVNKDSSEYEPIFCLNEYTSSLTLDELLPYKLDPWWQNLRRFMLLTFWMLVLFTFFTACWLSYSYAGRTSCNILETQISTNPIGMPNAASSIFAATTTFPIAIAKVLSP